MRTTFLPYCRPLIGEPEIEAAAMCLRAGWLTSGPMVKTFEERFAHASGVEYAVALNSCTAALHVALAAMGVGPGDEVIMPSLTFVAGAQCTLELGASPVFADIDADTLSTTVDTIAAVTTLRTKVIITMPYAGRPNAIASTVAFARARGIRVLEDAAHACGMLDRGEWAGRQSDAAAYSFYATKNLTTSEGGMLLTRDPALAERARMLGLHGMSKDAWNRYGAGGSWRYDVVTPGFKYNMPDPLAAIGSAQLAELATMQRRRDAIAQRYIEAFQDLEGFDVQAPPVHSGDRHSWCMFVLKIDPTLAGLTRDDVVAALKQDNIGTSVHYIPTHLLGAYRGISHAPLATTESVWERLVSLPLFPAMTDGDIDDVIYAVRQVARSTAARSAIT